MTLSIIPGTEAKDVVDSKMPVDMMSVHIFGRSVEHMFLFIVTDQANLEGEGSG